MSRCSIRNLRAAALLAALALSAACDRKETFVPPADLHVTTALSTNGVCVGDVVTLKVTVEHPTNLQVRLPQFGRDKKVVLRNQTQAPDTVPGRTEFALTLSSFEVGSHLVVTGRVEGVRGEAVVLSTNFPDVILRVESALISTNQPPSPNFGLVRWPAPPVVRNLRLLGLILLGIVLLTAAFLLLRRRMLRKAAEPAAPPPTPYEVAMEALKRLLELGWIEEGRVEPFFVELSAIVRTYVEARFALRAPEQTTEEFIRAAASSSALSLEHRQLIVGFLTECDLVKFARHTPGAPEMRAAYDATERFVRESYIPPAPATPAASSPQPETPPGGGT